MQKGGTQEGGLFEHFWTFLTSRTPKRVSSQTGA